MSDTPQNPFEAMMRQAQEMTEAWTKTLTPGMGGFNPAQMDKLWPTVPAEMLEAFFGKQFNPTGLDAKTRLLLTLLGQTVQGALAEGQIRLTVRHAVEAGATKQEVAETIGLAALFGGVPAMNKAMELAAEVLDAKETG